MSQTLQSVLCITTNKYLVRVLVVLLHARFSVVSTIPFLLAAIFFPGSSLYRKYYRTSRYSAMCTYDTQLGVRQGECGIDSTERGLWQWRAHLARPRTGQEQKRQVLAHPRWRQSNKQVSE